LVASTFGVPCFLLKAKKMICCAIKSILSPLAVGFTKTTTERPLLTLPWVRSWRSFVHPSDLPLNRAMDIRESSFDATTAQKMQFLRHYGGD
jgi:hypothetical protein